MITLSTLRDKHCFLGEEGVKKSRWRGGGSRKKIWVVIFFCYLIPSMAQHSSAIHYLSYLPAEADMLPSLSSST